MISIRRMLSVPKMGPPRMHRIRDYGIIPNTESTLQQFAEDVTPNETLKGTPLGPPPEHLLSTWSRSLAGPATSWHVPETLQGA